MRESIMRITAQGMVPIPPEIQERLGLIPDTEVQLVVEGDALRITKSTRELESRGEEVIRRLRGRAASPLSTDEIMAMTRGDE
jgi:antitoxin component of MazEF toxin-antitoxin module